MKTPLINLAVAATLSLAAFSASAEDMYRGAWYLVPSLNYLNADNSLESKNGAGVSLKLAKELSSRFDVQGGLSYGNAKNSAAGATGGRYKQTTAGFDALYMFSRSNVRPFLLAGLGVSRNNLSYSGVPHLVGADTSRTSPEANVGLGLQYLLNDKLGLQVDLREQWSRGVVPNSAGTSSQVETLANTILSVGGIVRFGAVAQLPVVAAADPVAPVADSMPKEATPAVEACKPTSEVISIASEKLFDFDKAALKAEGMATLEEMAAKIKASSEIKTVIVTGHTDRIGSDEYNQKLSEKRAAQVANTLIAQGVDAALITSSGKGETQPVVQCAGNKATKKLVACLQPNRRVEVRAEGSKEIACK